jgi:fatty acid synthase
VAVTGKIRHPENVEKEQLNLPIPTVPKEPEHLELHTEDVYKDLRLRGYDYSGYFQGILSADNRGTAGKLSWSEDWISFMDMMLQFSILGKDTRDLFLPTRLQQAVIDPVAHKQAIEKVNAKEGLPVRFRMLI